MAQELVWARVGDSYAAVSKNEAEAEGYEVTDESPTLRDGSPRRSERAAKKTSASKKGAEKKAAEVIASEPASDNENEENSR